MNRRHEPVSSQTQKKSKKAVRDGVKKDRLPQEEAEGPVVVAVKASAKTKKTSKRTNISDQTKEATPSSANKEGSRWAHMLQKQTAENNLRLQRQQEKNTSSH